MKMKKKVIIELEIDAESCACLDGNPCLDGKLLEQAVEKDLPVSVESRLDSMSGDVGCYNDGKPFGYKYKSTGFTIE